MRAKENRNTESGLDKCPWCTVCEFCHCSVPKDYGTKKGNHEYCEQKAENL